MITDNVSTMNKLTGRQYRMPNLFGLAGLMLMIAVLVDLFTQSFGIISGWVSLVASMAMMQILMGLRVFGLLRLGHISKVEMPGREELIQTMVIASLLPHVLIGITCRDADLLFSLGGQVVVSCLMVVALYVTHGIEVIFYRWNDPVDMRAGSC